ncbi:hypothetical protein DMA11_01630 [Marinilabiliaceae bacterium JC017]|nr:hypothetical protein DMA11_01630 [Marinilabiliaceae bacterium JC017]
MKNLPKVWGIILIGLISVVFGYILLNRDVDKKVNEKMVLIVMNHFNSTNRLPQVDIVKARKISKSVCDKLKKEYQIELIADRLERNDTSMLEVIRKLIYE